jgi:hypothetical protein
MRVEHPFARAVLVSAALLLGGGCAGQSAEMRRASTVAAPAADCGSGIVPEATLTKDDGHSREYDVGCDFSLVKVTCTDEAGCILGGPGQRGGLRAAPEPPL